MTRDVLLLVVVMASVDTGVAAAAIEAAASMKKLVGEGVMVANGSDGLDVVVVITAVSFMTLVADRMMLWSLECAIEVARAGADEDTEEKALA